MALAFLITLPTVVLCCINVIFIAFYRIFIAFLCIFITFLSCWAYPATPPPTTTLGCAFPYTRVEKFSL
jgi:hypothetical protein